MGRLSSLCLTMMIVFDFVNMMLMQASNLHWGIPFFSILSDCADNTVTIRINNFLAIDTFYRMINYTCIHKINGIKVFAKVSRFLICFHFGC
jgi:hypothetical protein